MAVTDRVCFDLRGLKIHREDSKYLKITSKLNYVEAWLIVFWCTSNSSKKSKSDCSISNLGAGFLDFWISNSAELRKELSSGFHFTPKSSTRPRTVAWRKNQPAARCCQVAKFPNMLGNYLYGYSKQLNFPMKNAWNLQLYSDLTDSVLRAPWSAHILNHSCHLVFSDQNPAPNYHQLICSKLGILQINQHHFLGNVSYRKMGRKIGISPSSWFKLIQKTHPTSINIHQHPSRSIKIHQHPSNIYQHPSASINIIQPGRVVCGCSSVADPQRPATLRESTADADPPWRSSDSPGPGWGLAAPGRCRGGSTCQEATAQLGPVSLW